MTEAVPQQFVTEEGETQAPQTVEPVDQESTDAAQGRRGRPRSQEAMGRDEAVFETLNGGAQLTRNEIAEKVGFTGGLTYLSLYRLKRDGRVVRVADGSTRRAWRQTTDTDVQGDTTGQESVEVPTPAEG